VICTKDNNIYYSSFNLPKETEISDSILYPVENKNILSYEQWIKGENLIIFENNNRENVNENDINNDENEFKNKNKQNENIKL